MTDADPRVELVRVARTLHEAGYSPGTSGNISVRVDDGIIVSPTGARFGSLDSANLSVVDLDGLHVAGPKPTKEALFHAAVYRARPGDRVVIHLHSPYASALSCLAGLDPADALPAYTPYYIMRVGRLPVIDYFPPGDASLADAIEATAVGSRAMLLANHGSLVSGPTFDAAAAAAEEIEETARLHFTLGNRDVRLLSASEVDELRLRYP
jgi:ribulose-5-phosphate 4-epimerase/fuculose-1-phosphate aldolase